MVLDSLHRHVAEDLQLAVTERVPKLTLREQTRKMRTNNGTSLKRRLVRRHHTAVFRPKLTGSFSVRPIYRRHQRLTDTVDGGLFGFDGHSQNKCRGITRELGERPHTT